MFSKLKAKKADVSIVKDAHGKYWFTLYQDKTGKPLAGTVAPGYDTYAELREAVQELVDIDKLDELEYEDRTQKG